MYTVIDFTSKKQLKEAFKQGRVIEVYQPGRLAQTWPMVFIAPKVHTIRNRTDGMRK